MELGELLFKQAKLLVVPDVVGGADGVLGVRGLAELCIHSIFAVSSPKSTTRTIKKDRRASGFNFLPLQGVLRASILEWAACLPRP